jgi:hypothetical protein
MIAGREDGRPSGPGDERSDKLPSRPASSRLRQLILKILRHLIIKMTTEKGAPVDPGMRLKLAGKLDVLPDMLIPPEVAP